MGWNKFLAGFVFVMGLLVPLVILGAYFWAFKGKSISYNSDDWSAFGAILAGAFTLLGSIATALALFFVSQQLELARSVASRQMESMTLDQYIGHRKVFGERLETLQKHFEGSIRFISHDELYGQIFSRNTPVHVELVVPSDDGGKGRIAHLVKLYEELHDSALEIVSGKVELAHRFVIKLLRFQKLLGYKVLNVEGYGTVRYSGSDRQVNLFSLMASINRAESVLNSYLFFSGNKQKSLFRIDSFIMRDLAFLVIQAYRNGKVSQDWSVCMDAEKKLERLLDLYGFCIEVGCRVSSEENKLVVLDYYDEVLNYLRGLLSKPLTVKTKLDDSLSYSKLIEELEERAWVGFARERDRGDQEMANKRKEKLKGLFKNLRDERYGRISLFD
ncbi:TPA: hypothetical protein ACU9ZY_002423 [Pseudomonas aeruginosa]|nr:hypothetical protein [Pseudomonas aeruginosa]